MTNPQQEDIARFACLFNKYFCVSPPPPHQLKVCIQRPKIHDYCEFEFYKVRGLDAIAKSLQYTIFYMFYF